MLIVLAILVTLMALAWPAIRKPLARHRLQSAAKQLRAELVRTRLEAIRSGCALEVRYLPGSRAYCVEPLSTSRGPLNRPGSRDASRWSDVPAVYEDTLPANDSLTTRLASQEEPTPTSEMRDLPRDICFALVEQPVGAFADPAAVDTMTQAESDAGAIVEEEWSEPIVFYPNGRTSDAVIELIGEHDYHLSLKLRGITGAVTVGPLQVPASHLADDSSVVEESLDQLVPPPRMDARAPALSSATP